MSKYHDLLSYAAAYAKTGSVETFEWSEIVSDFTDEEAMRWISGLAEIGVLVEGFAEDRVSHRVTLVMKLGSRN